MKVEVIITMKKYPFKYFSYSIKIDQTDQFIIFFRNFFRYKTIYF